MQALQQSLVRSQKEATTYCQEQQRQHLFSWQQYLRERQVKGLKSFGRKKSEQLHNRHPRREAART